MRKILMILGIVVLLTACAGDGSVMLGAPAGSAEENIALYKSANPVDFDPADKDNLIEDYFGRENLFFESNLALAVTDETVNDIKSEIEGNLLEGNWRLRTDWVGFGSQLVSLWQKGDLNLYILAIDGLTSDEVRQMNLRYGVVGVETGQTMTLAFVFDQNQPLPDLTREAAAESASATEIAETASYDATQTARDAEAAATVSAEKTLTAQASQTAAAATRTAAVTPVPTEDPYPPLDLPFVDNFEGAIRSEWRLQGSEAPVILDGRLTAVKDSKVSLEIGNADLKEYTLEMDFLLEDWDGAFRVFFTPNISMTLEPRLFNPSYLEWAVFSENEWKTVSTQRSEIFTSSDPQRVEITRRGDNYEIFLDGALEQTMTFGSGEGSPLIIQIEDSDIRIDNLTIK